MQRPTLALLLAFGVASEARAQNTGTQTGMMPTNGTGQMGTGVTKEDFVIAIRPKGRQGRAYLREYEAKTFFNRARCECNEPVTVVLEMTTSGVSKRMTYQEEQISLEVGPENCASTQAVKNNITTPCEPIGGPYLLRDLAAQRTQEIQTTTGALFGARGCAAPPGPQVIWGLVRKNAVEANLALLDENAPSLSVQLDGAAPPSPPDIRVSPGNEALEVRWGGGMTRPTDFQGYVVFCARGGEIPVYAKSYYDGKYFTRETVCGAGTAADEAMPSKLVFATGDDAVDEGIPVEAPSGFRNLDTAFACSELLTTQTSQRLTGLQNGIPYVVAVASVDRHGNATPVANAIAQTPIPTRDFYRGYRASGGEAEGGFCTYGGGTRRPASGTALVAGLALAGAALVRRRRR